MRLFYWIIVGVTGMLVAFTSTKYFLSNQPITSINEFLKKESLKREQRLQNWCYDQGGTARFDRYNYYTGCKVTK